MVLCACWLLLRGRIEARPVLQNLRACLRRRWRGPLTDLRPELGKCWLATIDPRVPSDADIGSVLVVLEDGLPLARAHAGHDEIRQLGRGRYSHWSGTIYFATSDDSDPRTNGRSYTAEER
jgi:hypothetical protein